MHYLGKEQLFFQESAEKKPQISPQRCATLCRKTFPGKVRRTADPSAARRDRFASVPRHAGAKRDDKGEDNGSYRSGCRTKAFFITSGGPQAHDSSVEKHFHEGSAELQIPPRQAGTGRLRSESVTFSISLVVCGRKAPKSICQQASPGFLRLRSGLALRPRAIKPSDMR
jgi:hypothetical protein